MSYRVLFVSEIIFNFVPHTELVCKTYRKCFLSPKMEMW